MAKKELSLILEKELFKTLKKNALNMGISIEKYVVKVLGEFNNVKWWRKNYSIIRKLYS